MTGLGNRLNVAWSSNWHRAGFLLAICTGAAVQLMLVLGFYFPKESWGHFVANVLAISTFILIAGIFVAVAHATDEPKERLAALHFNAWSTLIGIVLVLAVTEVIRAISGT